MLRRPASVRQSRWDADAGSLAMPMKNDAEWLPLSSSISSTAAYVRGTLVDDSAERLK